MQRREGVEGVPRSLEQLGVRVIAGREPVIDADFEGEDTSADLVGDGQREEGAESEIFTLTDALMRVNLLSYSFEGCRQFIRNATVIVFIPHFR